MKKIFLKVTEYYSFLSKDETLCCVVPGFSQYENSQYFTCKRDNL